MKQLVVVAALMIGGVLVWLLGSRLSSDALGMGAGIIFGVLAGIPTALLVLASNRRQAAWQDDGDGDDYGQYHRQPQVTVNNNYYDNRQLTVNTNPQSMPLLADRQREIQTQRGRPQGEQQC